MDLLPAHSWGLIPNLASETHSQSPPNHNIDSDIISSTTIQKARLLLTSFSTFSMIRTILFTVVLLMSYGSVQAQTVEEDMIPNVSIGIHLNGHHNFQLNSVRQEQAQSQGISLSMYDYEQYPIGIDFILFRGFHSSVDFLFGMNIFRALINHDLLRLKAGVGFNRFVLNDYKREYEVVGGEIEDQFPDSFKPYLELEWPFTRLIVLRATTGYRFSNGDFETVTEIVDRYPNGKPSRVNVSNNFKWYGSGWEFGLGLHIKIY